MNAPKVAILIPCYKRSEYTAKCIRALDEAQDYSLNVKFFLVDDNSEDETWKILWASNLPKELILHRHNQGLRKIIIDFFKKTSGFDFISKIDNDCIVPKNWLNDIISVFDKSDVGVLSPNVNPSNAAFKLGAEDSNNLGYRPSQIVGGVWTMRRNLVDGVYFEEIDSAGITGAFNLLKQILVEKAPKIGWLENVTFEDLGHWSGQHPDHIKSEDHELYSMEVGRRIAWSA